jgi:hypothetical protein
MNAFGNFVRTGVSELTSPTHSSLSYRRVRRVRGTFVGGTLGGRKTISQKASISREGGG